MNGHQPDDSSSVLHFLLGDIGASVNKEPQASWSAISEARFRDRLHRIAETVHRRKRKAARAGWLSTPKLVKNPILTALALELTMQANEAQRRAMDIAVELIGRIAEEPNVFATSTVLFLLNDKGTLKPICSYNADSSGLREMSINESGIVPQVARTGRALVESERLRGETLVETDESIRSQWAIPVVFGDRVLGVLYLESFGPDHCEGDRDIRRLQTADAQAESYRMVENISARAAELVPQLLVLRALEPDAPFRLPWHPTAHGWDLHRLLRRLCEVFCREVDSNLARCAIWRVDREKERLKTYATYGCDWVYLDQKSLELSNSYLGKFALSGDNDVVCYRPAEEPVFVEKEKINKLRIEHGMACNVFLPGASDLPVAIINAYFGRMDDPQEQASRLSVVKEALPEFALIVGRLIEAFQVQRSQIALGTLDIELEDKKNDTLSARLECSLETCCHVFNSPAGSIFALDETESRLQCVASTGFRKIEDTELARKGGIPERDCNFGQVEINIPSHTGQSHTISAFCRQGASLRRDRLDDQGEKGVDDCPKSGGSTAPEFIAGEKYEFSTGGQRRFLACAILDGERAIGVLRLARPKTMPPFTQCDALLIEQLCRRIGKNTEDGRRIEVSNASIAELVELSRKQPALSQGNPAAPISSTVP